MTMTVKEMKKLNGECCQDNCNEKGTHTMYWPSNPPKLVCPEHAKKAVSIAMALGFHLHIVEND